MSALLLVLVVDHFGVDDVLLRVGHVARARLVRGRVGVLPGSLGGLVDRFDDGALALVELVERRLHSVVVLTGERRLQRVDVGLQDRQSVVSGKSVAVRLYLGGRRTLNKKMNTTKKKCIKNKNKKR